MDLLYYLYWDLWRFFKALFTGKNIKVSKEKRQERLKICQECPLRVKEARFLWYKKDRCGICHCYLDLKTWLDCESCPDKPSKW